MERKIIAFLSALLFTVSVYATSVAHSDRASFNTTQIEQFTGAKGQLDSKENVFKVSVPRDDLSVTVAGVRMVPAMGMTSWAAFKAISNHMMVMGDLVLTENQVNVVMDVALNNGLAVTALHNHFFWDNPHIMFMHIEGMGNEADLAKAVGKVFVEIKATSGGKIAAPKADINPANIDIG